MKTHIFQLLFFFFIALNAFTQNLKLETIKCKVTLDEEKRIEQMIKFQSAYYKGLFDIDFKPIQIQLFGRYKGYKKTRDSVTSKRVKSNSGFYSTIKKKIYVHKSEQFLRVIYHEINHALVSQIIKQIPLWINEGMAEFFEYFTVKNNGVLIKLRHNRLNNTKSWIHEDKINLKEFLSYSGSEWKKNNIDPKNFSYTVSYSFIYYLYLAHPKSIGDILKQLNEGVNSVEAVEKSTGFKIEILEEKFKEFLL